MRGAALGFALFLGLTLSGDAVPAPPLQRGTFRGSSYASIQVDLRKFRLEILAYGRQGKVWTSAYRSLADLPQDCLAAINGTFFSLRWNEPAGVLVYDQGHAQWTPRFKRAYGNRELAVSTLSRWYLAVDINGVARLGNSQGRTAEQLRSQLEPPGLRALLGGGGCLVREGARAISPRTLEAEGFDERSGLRPLAAVPRSGLGLDSQGRVLLVTAGLEGGGLGLNDFADLLVTLGARQAIFLDCGSSTAMRAGSWQRDSGRPLPTWLVVREGR